MEYPHYVEVGQQIRILGTDDPASVADLPDFYLLDDEVIVGLVYGDDRRFVGAVQRPAEAADVGRAEELWSSATPFDTWWLDHRGLHGRIAQ